MAEHIDLPARDRAHEPPGHGAPLHPQLRVRRRDDDVELVEQFRLLVEGAVLEDVDLDSRQQREAVPAHARHDLELGAQAFGRQPVRDAQARGVIGEGQILVPQRTRRLDHEVDRGQSIRPVAVTVQIAAQQTPQGRRALHARAFAQIGEVRRNAAFERLLDHGERRVADPLPAPQARGIPHLLVAQTADRVCRRAERLRLVSR